MSLKAHLYRIIKQKRKQNLSHFETFLNESEREWKITSNIDNKKSFRDFSVELKIFVFEKKGKKMSQKKKVLILGDKNDENVSHISNKNK